MNSKKKASRIGSDALLTGIAAASAEAQTRIAKLDGSDVDQVSGAGIIDDIIDIDVTMGMYPEPDPDPNNPFENVIKSIGL
ncbi:hypothetical protein FGU71_04265 [Erythrobacter insulae]|uniref:Uncharacterized protein n=1 Tax=Erythrobacter insulae TaxID=2584124 RepID=A0A547PAH0_9SPHN|nr:hypothetical protein [Erythrobacter insulae]TRD11142.1 hypothetical protein FGU71_04265 [Erythrobacter insulae]